MGSYVLQGDGPQGTVVLEGDWLIQEAAKLKEAFANALERYKALSIDLSRVQSVDVTFFQVICAVQNELRTRGQNLEAAAPLPRHAEELADNLGLMLNTVDQCFWRRDE